MSMCLRQESFLRRRAASDDARPFLAGSKPCESS